MLIREHQFFYSIREFCFVIYYIFGAYFQLLKCSKLNQKREGCANFVNQDKKQFTSQIYGNLFLDQVLPVIHPHTFPVAQIFPLSYGNRKSTLQLLKNLYVYYLYNLTLQTIFLQGMYRIHVDVTTLCQDLFIELMVRACYHFYHLFHFEIICF